MKYGSRRFGLSGHLRRSYCRLGISILALLCSAMAGAQTDSMTRTAVGAQTDLPAGGIQASLPAGGTGQMTDVWTIPSGPINPSAYFGETVANGMLGIVSSPDPFTVKEVVLNGTFDSYGRGGVSNILKTFNLVNMYLDVDGERIERGSQVRDMQQVLDMKHANLSTHFEFADKISVDYTYYSLRQLPNTALVDVTVTAKKDVEIVPASVMQAPDMLKDVQNYYNEIDGPHGPLSLLISTAKSPTGKLLIAAANGFIFDPAAGGSPSVIHDTASVIHDPPAVIHEMWDNNMHLMKFSKRLKAGETYHFAVVCSTITSAQVEDPLNEAQRLTIFALLQGTAPLLRTHREAWDKLWKSDILIEGDAVTQREVHSMLYHLYSFAREGTAYSLSPMGLSGLGYNGHIFWDAEIWMYPALLLLQPKIAASMIEYRYQHLQAARQNAFTHGYKGAMFPWESAASGGEETPIWALTGPFEHHITADVGIAAWNYFCVTQDKTWLREKGYPLLKETADFWASRVERNGPGHYDIKNVVAADEWAENVDNNAFTNAAAKANLKFATDAATLLGVAPDPDWMEVYRNIPILKLPDGVTSEHAAYHGEPIKQADVNLLAYPLHEITDRMAIRRDLDYYKSRVGDGPAMTQAIFAILYARLGMPDSAYALFKAGYTPNKRPPFGVIAETATGDNPYFATGAGGLLQAMLNGFGGLEIGPEGISQLKTTLPASWKSLRLTGIGPGQSTFSVK
jgi:trehalose/maltose hydrolase-like predicted phosphorylase